MPAGQGKANIVIQKCNVKSAVKQFTYTTTNAQYANKVVAKGPFVVVEYCYGFLFAAQYGSQATSGIIKQYKVLDNYNLQLVKTITTVKNQAPQGSTAVLGLTCDPFMKHNNFDIYVHHSKLF